MLRLAHVWICCCFLGQEAEGTRLGHVWLHWRVKGQRLQGSGQRAACTQPIRGSGPSPGIVHIFDFKFPWVEVLDTLAMARSGCTGVARDRRAGSACIPRPAHSRRPHEPRLPWP